MRWTVSRLDHYHLFCLDLLAARRLRDVRELLASILKLDRRLSRSDALDVAQLCARAWHRFPKAINQLLQEILPPEVGRLCLPPDEVWSEPNLRAQIIKASKLRRAANQRYSALILALPEMERSQRATAIQDYIAKEPVVAYQRLARELLKKTTVQTSP